MLRPIKVTFANGEVLETSCNGTDEDIRSYYVGKEFNRGIFGNDDMQRAVSVEILTENTFRYDDLTLYDSKNHILGEFEVADGQQKFVPSRYLLQMPSGYQVLAAQEAAACWPLVESDLLS